MVETFGAIYFGEGKRMKVEQQGFHLFFVRGVSVNNPKDTLGFHYLASKSVGSVEGESSSKSVFATDMLDDLEGLFFFFFLDVLDVCFDTVGFGGCELHVGHSLIRYKLILTLQYIFVNT